MRNKGSSDAEMNSRRRADGDRGHFAAPYRRRHGGHAEDRRCHEGADPAGDGPPLRVRRLRPLAARAVICICEKLDLVAYDSSAGDIDIDVTHDSPIQNTGPDLTADLPYNHRPDPIANCYPGRR